MKIRLLPEAEHDIEMGADFYESQNPGLGAYFTDCIATDVDSLMTYGGIHEQYRGYFRSLSKRFPFAIYYKLNGEYVEIYAILDARQAPHRIDAMLGKPRTKQ
jgi:plasmid stabilization system protein ParE